MIERLPRRHPRLVLGCFLFVATVVVLPLAARAQNIPGDTNCNGQVSEVDMDLLIARLFAEADIPDCGNFDVNRDGTISAADLGLLSKHLSAPPGPTITYVGVARTDGQPVTALGKLDDGTIAYHRSSGSGFQVVVEAMPGASRAQVGTRIFDPPRRPDFQGQFSNRLGAGSPAVCDEFGVPAIEPPDYSFTQFVANALNDFGCRGAVTTSKPFACTVDRFGQANFVDVRSRVQFCFPIDSSTTLPKGDTFFTVQLLDQLGNLGAAKRMLVRVAAGPMPATFTPVPPTETRTPTMTRTATRTPTSTRAPSSTRTRTSTRTPSPVQSATPTRMTSPVTPSVTPTPPVGTPTQTPTRTRTGSPTTTGTLTRTPSRTPSPSRTGTVTRTGTAPRTSTRTRTPTRTRSATPVGGQGPIITYFGLTGPSNFEVTPTSFTDDVPPIPIYERRFGCSFYLVVEAKKRAPSTAFNIAKDTYLDLGCPGVMVQATNPLGSGSTVICDSPDDPGGVPAINPPDLSDPPLSCNQFNDVGCLFDDGTNKKQGRSCSTLEACIRFASGESGCKMPDTNTQFCALLDSRNSLPSGSTLFTARVRDVQGRLSDPAQLIINNQESCGEE